MIVFRILRRLIRGTLVGMVRRWPTTLVALALVASGSLFVLSRGLIPGLPAMGGLPGFDTASQASASDAREMTVEDLKPSRSGEQINLTLKEKGGSRRLVMAVGPTEARAIAAEMNSRRTEGPMAYDLTRSLIRELGGTVNRVVVNNVDRDSYYAKVVMSTDGRQIEVDSRPSDAIALAVRSKVPIFAESIVLDKVGVPGSP